MQVRFQFNLSTYGTPGGGSFFGTGVIGSTFYPIISGAGSFTISYITSGSCKDTATRVIIVDPVPVASLTAFSDRCVDVGSFNLTGGAPAGGVYLYNGSTATTFDPSAVGAGTYTIKYAFSNTCGTDTATRTIKVNSLPTVTLSALSAVCAGAPAFSLSGGSPVGGTYSGTGVNSTTGIFTPIKRNSRHLYHYLQLYRWQQLQQYRYSKHNGKRTTNGNSRQLHSSMYRQRISCINNRFTNPRKL